MAHEDYAQERAAKLAGELAQYVNTLSDKARISYLCAALTNEHRTLQQSVTRFALAWLETVASDDYRTDGRNEASQVLARALIAAWEKEHGKGFYLPNI